MDIETLRLFVAACEMGNLSQVARRENMSPPTVTRRIQQLEKQLGVPLIKRVHKGIAPTAEGRLLMEKSATLLGHIESISESMPNHQRERTGVVTIIGSYSMTAGHLLDDIERFLAVDENKNVRVHLKEGHKQVIADDLRSGVAELGVFWNATDTSGLQLFPYRRDRVAVVVHAQHPLAQQDHASYEDMIQYDTVRTKTTRNVELMLERTGSIRTMAQHNRAEVPTFEALLRLVKTGRYACICPIEIATPYAAFYDLKILPLTDNWSVRNHVIACTNITTLSPGARGLLEHLQAMALQASTKAQ